MKRPWEALARLRITAPGGWEWAARHSQGFSRSVYSLPRIWKVTHMLPSSTSCCLAAWGWQLQALLQVLHQRHACGTAPEAHTGNRGQGTGLSSQVKEEESKALGRGCVMLQKLADLHPSTLSCFVPAPCSELGTIPRNPDSQPHPAFKTLNLPISNLGTEEAPAGQA